jgi:hypothetical protein
LVSDTEVERLAVAQLLLEAPWLAEPELLELGLLEAFMLPEPHAETLLHGEALLL